MTDRAICANCGAPAPGVYCPQCGQETKLALPSAAAFLRDAAGRYIALDGRAWRTLRDLAFRPGFLTREYFAGRRRRYIRPGRLFLVMSLAMFAVFRAVSYVPEVTGHTHAGDASTKAVVIGDDVGDPSWLAPLAKRANAFARLPRSEQTDRIQASFFRYGPYAAILLLPLFALLLKVVYAGRGARYPGRPRRYAAHLVFAAHYHAFLFLIGLVYAIAPAFLRMLLAGWAAAYGLFALKAVYRGRWSGVILRGALVASVYLVLFAMALAAIVVAAVALR